MKFTYIISINQGRATTPKSVHVNVVGNSPILSLSLLVKILKRRSNHLTMIWIPLNVGHLKSSNNSFNDLCKYFTR